MKPKPAPTSPIANSFEAVLRNQRKGRLLSDLSEQLQAATLACREHGKAVSLHLKLKISPANGDASAMSVTDEVSVKMPRPVGLSSLFYITDDGRLVRDDPNQSEMPLQALPDAKGKTAEKLEAPAKLHQAAS